MHFHFLAAWQKLFATKTKTHCMSAEPSPDWILKLSQKTPVTNESRTDWIKNFSLYSNQAGGVSDDLATLASSEWLEQLLKMAPLTITNNLIGQKHTQPNPGPFCASRR